MSPERWQQVRRLLEQALELDPSQRSAYLARHCSGDPDLRKELDSFLAAEQGLDSSFLEAPAVEVAGKGLAGEGGLGEPGKEVGSGIAGKTLGHYRIVEKLGGGGMGVVYKARDKHLDRFVALKLLPPERVADLERRLRFVQEAKLASALNHPNIIHIYDVAESEGTLFLAMEFVPGKTLGQIIGCKGLPLNQALKYATQITDGLAKAHSAGIVHRDLKPSNIMVTDDGLVKILDFGLAKLTEPTITELAETRSAAGAEVPRTEEGVIVGTASYMSPEQAQGKAVDARSDIFSFGAVLYEMLSGRKAFHGESYMGTLAQVLHQEPPPLHEIVQGIPPELERLAARCLRKDVERRLRSMADLRVALQELKEEWELGEVDAATPVAAPAARSRRKWWIAAALTGVLAGGLLWFLVPPIRTRQRALKEIPLTSYPGTENSPTFSPDGSQIAFSWNGEEQNNVDIYIKLVGPGPPLRLTTDPAEDIWPAWSPDGRTVAFLRDFGRGKYGVFLVPALGGPERKLGEVFIPEAEWLPGPYLAWLPDSKGIVLTHKDSPTKASSLFLLRIGSGEMRRVTTPPPGSMGDSAPALSPDGSALVFSRMTGLGPGDLYLAAFNPDFLPVNQARRITFFNWRVAGAAWTPTGRAIVFSQDGKLWKITLSRWSKRAGPPERIESIGNGASSPAISRQGSRLAYVSGYGGPLNVWRVAIPDWSGDQGKNAPAGAQTDLIPATRDEFAPQYSPDSKKIAFESARTGDLEIWTCASDGSNCAQVTSFGVQATGVPHWSPDGQLIAFYSRPEGKAQIFIVNPQAGAPQRLTNDSWENFFPTWSRDGRWIYFASNRTGTDQIWKISSGGGTPVRVTQNGGFACTESPDGRYLYYTRSRDPNASLWKMRVEGGGETKIVEAVIQHNFAVTRRGLYYMSQPDSRSKTKVIQFLSFADQKARMVASIRQDVYHGFSVSPDERWLLYAAWGSGGSNVMLVENSDLDGSGW
jgi:serine/threonine protein kinase/Tol biopolymer transport system component